MNKNVWKKWLSNRESGKNCGERGGGVFVSHRDAEAQRGEAGGHLLLFLGTGQVDL